MIVKLRSYIPRIFAASLILLLLFSSNAWETEAPFVSTVLFLVGAVLVGITSLGRLWCSLYIAGYKTAKLITEGPYFMCRNPLYFFSYLGALGVGLVSETFLIPFIILIAFAIYYPFVVKSEEAKLKKIHKNEFEEYLNKVPSFFPKFSYLTEPEEYIVKPVIFRKHIFDALWFVWFIGIIEINEELHELKVIPTLFRIY